MAAARLSNPKSKPLSAQHRHRDVLRHGQQADQDQHRARIAASTAQTCGNQNVVDGCPVAATLALQQFFSDPAWRQHARSRSRTSRKRSRREHGNDRCSDKDSKFNHGNRDDRGRHAGIGNQRG
jgi:hypothetical protein